MTPILILLEFKVRNNEGRSFNESTLKKSVLKRIPLNGTITFKIERKVKNMKFNQETNEKKSKSEKESENFKLDTKPSNEKVSEESSEESKEENNLDNPILEPEKDAIQNQVKQWFQDNLRILISILIVILIAGGIYSYSKRSEAPINQNENSSAPTEETNNQVNQENKNTTKTVPEEKKTEKKVEKKTTATEKKASSVATSQETEKSFIETASKGDSQTKLARVALANFLEKNPDSSLTAEHKIYIEDYLRKNVHFNKRVYVGTSIEFSKSLIKKSIAKSKTLTSNQLKNLHKYVVRVPSLS